MKRSDWITICSMIAGILISTIGSALYLSFKIGGVAEKVTAIEKTIEGMKTDIISIKGDITEIRVEMAEMKVKVDEMWRDHLQEKRP